MAEYINKQALLSEYDRVHVGPPGGARKLIEEAPAAEVVPVVHCRDCVYNGLDSMPHTKDKCYRLMLTCFTVKPEDFCAWGRKKDGE